MNQKNQTVHLELDRYVQRLRVECRVEGMFRRIGVWSIELPSEVVEALNSLPFPAPVLIITAVEESCGPEMTRTT